MASNSQITIIGTVSTCQVCYETIRFNGEYWEHDNWIVNGEYKHIARPSENHVIPSHKDTEEGTDGRQS